MDIHQQTAVFFCTPEIGHFQPLRALISRIAASGITAHVFTHRVFKQQVESAGGCFFDLFGAFLLDEADNESRPIPCRYVSFAGHYADKIIEKTSQLAPCCIISETFSVIGPVVAEALGVPHINVCAGHDMNPARLLANIQAEGRVAISEKCCRAVEKLRNVFRLKDASPFSYLSSLSSSLNIYCEPPQFLGQQAREAFQPVAFFGCLPDTPPAPPVHRTYFAEEATDALRVYLSFGTVIWRYFAKEAIAALSAISRALEEMDGLQMVISLGGAEVDPKWANSLENVNIRVMSNVDQAAILGQADLFITHHGLNSTHEAIYNRVPMISYPFFSDQPALARKCQEFGLAIPLTKSLRAPPKIDEVQAAVSIVLKNGSSFRSNLERARLWEMQTMDERELVIQQIKQLIQHAQTRTSVRNRLNGAFLPAPLQRPVRTVTFR